MDSWILVPCQRSRLDMLKTLLSSLEHPADRVVVVATFPDPICPWELQDYAEHLTTFLSEEHHIGKWWNQGLDYIQGNVQQKNYEVLALSSDMIGTNYSVATIGRFLRFHNLVMAGPNLQSEYMKIFNLHNHRTPFDRVPGCCWMLAGESGLRVDENFRWWYSDDDLEMQARKAGGVGIVPDTGLVAGPDTELSVEKEQWAAEDRQKFVAKWHIQPW